MAPVDPTVNKGKGKFTFDLKNPATRNLLIFAGVIGLLTFLWVDMYYLPAQTTISELEEKKVQVDADLLKINALKPQLSRLSEEADALSLKLDSLRNIFPDDKEVPRLIRQLTTVNRQSRIVTTRFTPKADVEQEYYIENKYDVSISGDYHNIGEFFSALANLQLIVNLTNVTLTANPGYNKDNDTGPMSDRTPSMLANFELTTFSSRR